MKSFKLNPKAKNCSYIVKGLVQITIAITWAKNLCFTISALKGTEMLFYKVSPMNQGIICANSIYLLKLTYLCGIFINIDNELKFIQI